MLRARSTSAAPTFFKAFTHAATGRIYLDGALKANNPVRLAEHERKLIWPCSGEFPDLHISIGTGTIRGVIATAAEGRVGGLLRQATGGVGMRVQIAKDAVRDIMNSETVWHNFCQPLTERDKSRYRRLNVPFTEEVPAMHDVSSLLVLQETAHTYCSTQEVAMQLKSIARQLVASTFYFDFESWTRPGQKWDCTGYLRNRMLPTHAHVESVENLISKRPVFRVYEDGVENSVSKTTVSPNDNLRRGIWSQKMLFSVSDRRRRLDIKIMLQGVEEEYSISGFPRTLESS